MITKSTTTSTVAVKKRMFPMALLLLSGLLGLCEDELKLLVSAYQRIEAVCWCKGELLNVASMDVGRVHSCAAAFGGVHLLEECTCAGLLTVVLVQSLEQDEADGEDSYIRWNRRDMT
ncbi:hypothetical protein Peur_013639 [Populus x canadensis]